MPFQSWNYLYLRPSRNVATGKTATSSAGTVDTEHPITWLTDGRPSFPTRWDAGAWGASIALGSAKDVQLVSVANHSLDADVTVGGASGTLDVTATPLENGTRLNPYFVLDSPSSISTLTLSGTNTGPIIIGDVFAGVPEEFPPLKMGSYWEELHDKMPDELQGDFLNVPFPDEGVEWRLFGGSQQVHSTVKAQWESWFRDQRSGSQFSLMVMDQTVNDARVVLVLKTRFTSAGQKDMWDADFRWVEIPRYNWN